MSEPVQSFWDPDPQIHQQRQFKLNSGHAFSIWGHAHGSAERTVPSHLLPCISFGDCALQASTVPSTPWSPSLGSYKAFNCLGQHLAATQRPMPTNTSNCFATFMGLLCLLVKNTKHSLLRHTRLLATNPSSLALPRNSRQQPWAGSKNIIIIQ